MQLALSFGDTLHYIALVVLVFQLTGQGLAVAGLAAAEVVPVLVLGPSTTGFRVRSGLGHGGSVDFTRSRSTL